MEKAFDYLIEKGHKAVNVIWATGRRIDHTLHNLTISANYQNQLKIVFWDDYSKAFLLPKKYQKWYTKDTILSLIPIGTVENITTENLFYPLQKENLKLGYRTGSSNHVANDGIVSIEFEKGDLILIES